MVSEIDYTTIPAVEDLHKPTEGVSIESLPVVGESRLSSLDKLESDKNSIRYNYCGLRYLVFSKQIKLTRDLRRYIFKTPPVLVDSTIVFSESCKYSIFTFNVANDEKTSQFKFDLEILNIMAATPITFGKDLYTTLSNLFEKKYATRLTIANNTKLYSINSLFQSLFSTDDYVSLYFPYIVDFRGRIYINSPLSITDVKLLRHVITPLERSRWNVDSKNQFYVKFNSIRGLLSTLKFDVSQFTEEKQILILVGLLNLGKNLKSKLIDSTCGVTLESFIQQGIDLYNVEVDENIVQDYKLSNTDDVAAILSMRRKLKNFIEKDELFSILLDSTASGIFHLNL